MVLLKEINDHITIIVARTIFREQKEQVRKQIVQSKYSDQFEKAFRVAKLRDKRI